MAEVKKARLFLRRGTDIDRIATTLCEGELGYSTDAFRVVVGDGTTAGGISLGTTIYVSGGSVASHFHTKLTTASAGGLAHTGDLAVFPALTYQNVSGGTVYPGPSATTVMLLTGSTPEDASSWVSVNSGIPWGNLTVSADDISGDKIHGGDVSGDVTFSGTVSSISLTALSAHVEGLQGTSNRSVIVTSTGQLTATEANSGPVMADGTLRWITPIPIKVSNGAGYYTPGTTIDNAWETFEFASTVPHEATTGLFQFVWEDGSGSATHDVLKVRSSSSGTAALTAVYEGSTNADSGGAQQFSCPLSSNGTICAFDWSIFEKDEDGSTHSTAVFNDGFNFHLIGYM